MRRLTKQLLTGVGSLLVFVVLVTGGVVGATMADGGAQSLPGDAALQTTTATGIDSFQVTDYSSSSYDDAYFEMSWAVTGEYEDVTVTVTNLDRSTVVETYSAQEGSEIFWKMERYGERYEIKLEATASDGTQLCEKYTGAADRSALERESCGDAGGSPDIVTESANVSSTTVDVGETVDVTAELTNQGEEAGDHTAELLVDGEVAATKNVSLDSAETKSISFSQEFTESGSYTLAVDNETAGTVTVEANQVEIRTDDISLDKTTVQSNEMVNITATFTNVGDKAGEVDINFIAEAVDTSGIGDDPVMPEIPDITVQLDPGETKTVTVGKNYGLDSGTYEITPMFHGETNATFVSKQSATLEVTDAPAAFTVRDASVDSTSVTTGDSVQTTATIENTGGSAGTYTAELFVDGTVVDSKDVTIASSDTQTVTFTYTFTAAGEYTLAVGNQTAGTVSVTEGSSDITIDNFEVSDSSTGGQLSSANLDVGWNVSGAENVTVTVTNLNSGEVEATYYGTDGVEEYYSNVWYDSAFAVTLEATSSDGDVVCKRLSGRADGADDFFARNSCEATGQPDISLIGASVSDTQMNVSDTVTVEATASNFGEVYGNKTIEFSLNGTVIETRKVRVLPSENRTRTIRYTFEESGEYTFTVNGETAGTVTVARSEEPDIKVREKNPVDSEVDAGELLKVNVTLENVGSAAGTKQLTLSSKETALTEQSVSVESGETKTVTLTADVEQTGRVSLYLNDDYFDSVDVYGPVVEVTEDYELTPSKENNVTVTLTFDTTGIDNQFKTKNTLVDDDTTILSKSGFTVEDAPGHSILVWDGETDQPSITVEHAVSDDVNEDAAILRSINYYEETNRISVVDRTGSPDIHVAKRDGEVKNVFIGNYEVYTTTTDNEEIELIVEKGLIQDDKLRVQPETILTIWERMSSEFDVNSYEDEITAYVSPTVDRASAGAARIRLGPYDDADTIAHEYVHIRQDFQEQSSALWLTEATATFYGGQFSFRYGDMSYDQYRSYYEGEPVNLTDPEKYDTDGDNYEHGSDVIHALDSEIRKATDNEKSFDDVFRRLNAEYDDGGLSHETFKQVVEDVAGKDMDTFFETYVSGKQTPSDDRNPGKYEFTVVNTISGTLTDEAASTGFVGASSKVKADMTVPGSIKNGYVVTDSPSEDGSWELKPLTGLENPIFDSSISTSEKGISYVQYEDDGQAFPKDGIPDIAMIGSTDGTSSSLPTETNIIDVEVVDQNGGVIGGVPLSLLATSEDGSVGVKDETGVDGVFTPGDTPGLELSGTYVLKSQPKDFDKQEIQAELTADRNESVQVVYHRDGTPNDITLHGSIVPSDEITAGNETTVSVLYSATKRIGTVTRSVPVYVDGQKVKTIDITSSDSSGAVEVTLTLDEAGNQTVRFGDLPGQTVSVNGSDDGNEGDDYEPVLETFSVTDQSTQGYYGDSAEFDISWDVTHEGNALEDVTVTVTNLDRSIDRETYSGATGSQTYYDSGGYWDDEYDEQFRIRIEAVDDNGDSICVEFVGPADGNSDNLERSSCSSTAGETADQKRGLQTPGFDSGFGASSTTGVLGATASGSSGVTAPSLGSVSESGLGGAFAQIERTQPRTLRTTGPALA